VEVPYGASVASKSRDSMTVTVDKYESKTVPLKIRTKTDDERYVWEFYGPEEVTIEGYSADLAKVEEVSTEVIDLTKVTETGEVGLTYELPEGIKVSDRDAAATMSVYVTPRREVTVTVPAGEVIVTGLSDKLQCEVEDDVENKTTTFRIRRINRVYDVSAVSRPADPNTSISARRVIDGAIDARKLREAQQAERDMEHRRRELALRAKAMTIRFN
jgi:hypothetical protein